jgi:predicted Fe-Mo cluster-binding NifX family protein
MGGRIAIFSISHPKSLVFKMEGKIMRIAISADGDFVSAHFGRCPFFVIADIYDGKLVKKEGIDNPGHQPGFIPQFLHQKGVECIIAGGMGRRAEELFKEYNIETIVGVSGKIDEVLNDIQKGTLQGAESLCRPGSGKGYGVEKGECDHVEGNTHNH